MHALAVHLHTCNLFLPPQKLTSVLQQRRWEKTSHEDAVTRFQYAAYQQQITANLERSSGPGWEASIDGQQAVSLIGLLQHYDKCDCVL